MKIIRLLSIAIAILICISCSIKMDDLENAKIYTTIYPINYITTYLYSDYSEISSIYPKDSDPATYKLNDAQYKNYSKADLFIYNGFSNEKQIAKELLNKNSNLQIIDVTYGLSENNVDSDLWFNPNNYLIVAKNIKNYLEENLKSKFIIEAVNKKYSEFEEKISIVDARLHNLSKKAASSNKVIVVADNTYDFLTNYGFNIVNLSDESMSKNNKLDTIKSYFKTSKYRYILAKESQKDDELLTSLKGTILTIREFNGIDETDYFNFMTNFIDQIETIVS